MKTTPWWKEPTRAQWCSFTAAWLGWVLDAFDAMIYALVAGDIAAEFGVSKVAVMGSLTLTLVVRLVGGGVAGWMADRWGRKLPLMLSLLWLAVFDAAIYAAPTFTAVLVLRTIFGLGMGAEWTAGTAMAMENWPASSRKIASGLLQAGWPVGFLLAALAAAYVVPAWGWRSLFLLAAIPALLVIPIRFFVKDNHVRPARAEAKPRMAELFAPGVLRMIVLGSLVMALGFVVYYGLTSNYTLMLVDQGVAPRDAYFHLIAFNLGMLGGVVAAGVLANRRGVITAIIAPALLMVPAVPLFVGWVPGWTWIGAVLGGALGAGYSGVTPALVTQIFDDRVRARAIGFVYHAGALIAAFVPTAIPLLSEHTNIPLSGAIAIVVSIGLLAMSAAVFLLRRTITAVPSAVHEAPTAPATRLPLTGAEPA
jgi:SHS family lactate transporter-like MFS transporter